MSLNNRPIVVKNNPTIFHLFNIFSKFRNDNDYDGLVNYLTTNYPQNVKNRTFNFNNTGHTFHILYAYVPSLSNKERKQIRLDCIEKLLQNTKNDFKLYEDLMNIIIDENKCPCELISARLNDNILYNENLKNKNFDIKPSKLKKEPIDAILFKYSINWKNSLNKKRSAGGKRKSGLKFNTDKIEVDLKNIVTPSTLSSICGFTIGQCEHVLKTEDHQLRAGDEIVSFIKYCIKCGCTFNK
ncbi:LEF-5 [Choristoneura occidentalis granulovirus]|uniref:LEF-5 n=1 Tax=Choristoneura occidentalis granulovirus TaxID=364745 RepID=Q1A4M8_9BBAC|nr:LEF-5 [Choristoneura fumiferana granulovirus]ABC61202.1 LEF-5 [Choristoneura fumiferana granulovirus]